MAIEGNLEYASARVQAQHGRLPGEADWQRLGASRDLGHYLDSTRGSALAAWTSSFDAHQDLHSIERSLRSQWKTHVERVASWHPRACQPWLRWLAWLPALPLLAHLARGEHPPAWLLADPVCGPIAGGNPGERAAAVIGTPLAPLASGISERASLAALWRGHWARLAPRTDPDTRAHMDQLLAAIDRHAAAVASAGSTPELRAGLAGRLETLFRSSQGTVVASACHLGRLALALERLRGELASRYVLPPGTEESN